eukprot:3338197-Lingulodinium_polyedra.AAC.1
MQESPPSGGGGVKGGTMAGFRNHINVARLPGLDAKVVDLTPWILHLKGQQVLLVASYLRPGVGIAHE